jgi:hypothetical protein
MVEVFFLGEFCSGAGRFPRTHSIFVWAELATAWSQREEVEIKQTD